VFPTSSEGKETHNVLGPLETTNLNRWILSKGPNRVDISLPSTEDEKRSSVRNVVFSSYLEFQTIDKVQKTSDSEGQKMYTGTQNAFFAIVFPSSDIILIC
jgi:hypothetical protein